MRALRDLGTLLLVIFCLALSAFPQANPSAEQILHSGRVALQHQNYAEAIRLLEDGTTRYPENLDLKLELGRAYLYDRKDQQATRLFREILTKDPANRLAKLELARALGYHRDYKPSDQLYRELLAAHPDDEAASIGLVRNLIRESRNDEARRVCDLALSHHPQSENLQKYHQQLTESSNAYKPLSGPRNREPLSPAQNRPGQVQASTAYFSDSAGNRSWRSTQLFDRRITPRFSNRMRMEERSLWVTGGPSAGVLWGTDELRAKLTPAVAIIGAVGGVRFNNASSRLLYRDDLELHPVNHLWITGGFGRRPISPTFTSAQFNLLAEGWHARLEYYPRAWWIDASWSSEHYTDSNRNQRFGAEALRWFGSPQLSVGAGYRFDYLAFDQTLLHGYFNPSDYNSHLARSGLRFLLGKHFHAEYLGGAGAESVAGGPYRTAWELTFRNRLKFDNWEFSGEYFYFHIAQNTGAFRSQGARLAAAYYF